MQLRTWQNAAMSLKRLQIRIEGIVQGVGFRPFVFRLASESRLNGWVLNDSAGVLLEVEGFSSAVDDFVAALSNQLPPLASISRFYLEEQPLTGESGFRIVSSQQSDHLVAQISPDTHVCQDCLQELFDPSDRRYLYPFINCTNCGPRYSLVTAVPYDRPSTTMADFQMCSSCQQEYDNPVSRRFHAQPNACSACGPDLKLYDHAGHKLATRDPLAEVVKALHGGQIVAIKGLGGYHLAVDPHNEKAVARLRQRKKRDEKPFALMARDLDAAAEFVQITTEEKRLLETVERPIVLLEQRAEQRLICQLVAPRNRYFGVMLPYTPLHYLLLQEFPALVMTSANQTDEPIVFEDTEVFSHLAGIADLYLGHNRRIHIRTDDSIVRVLADAPVLMRRSRGYVPRAVRLPVAQPVVLAVGAELKNCICLTSGDRATLSHHIGDLKNPAVLKSLHQANDHLQQLLGVHPELIAHDLHPDYASTSFAQTIPNVPKLAIQHHHAHLASCLVDNGRDEEVIGVIFDGIGYGSDQHIWGGEFLLGDLGGFERVGHLSELAMPGGDAATREPWRMAFSLLYQAFGEDIPELSLFDDISPADKKLLCQMLGKGINSPLTSSCGRLFDAVSALAGLRNIVSYEGQAALELEMCLDDCLSLPAYTFELEKRAGQFVVTFSTLTRQLVADLEQGVSAGQISARFHQGLADIVLQSCVKIRAEYGARPVVLSGGVFQNAYLTERVCQLLKNEHFEVLTHRQVPPNDGGIALGQAAIAGRFLQT